MRLTIFGATGATGMELIRQGLTEGHQMTCLVRTPAIAKLPSEVRQIQGDVRDAEAVTRVIGGSDAVLSALGSGSLKKNDLLDQASANILAGMKKSGVRRIIVLGAAGAIYGVDKNMNWMEKLVLKIIRNTILKYPFLDQTAQEDRFKVSDVDYTIVRPPRLTNDPYTGKYRMEADSLPRAAKSIPRADVADCMLKQLNDERFIRRGIYVAR